MFTNFRQTRAPEMIRRAHFNLLEVTTAPLPNRIRHPVPQPDPKISSLHCRWRSLPLPGVYSGEKGDCRGTAFTNSASKTREEGGVPPWCTPQWRLIDVLLVQISKDTTCLSVSLNAVYKFTRKLATAKSSMEKSKKNICHCACAARYLQLATGSSSPI